MPYDASERPWGRHGEWPSKPTRRALADFVGAVDEAAERDGLDAATGERLRELHRAAEQAVAALPKQEQDRARELIAEATRRLRSMQEED